MNILDLLIVIIVTATIFGGIFAYCKVYEHKAEPAVETFLLISAAILFFGAILN